MKQVVWLIRTYMGDHFLFFGNAWEGVVGRVWEAVFSVIPRYFPSRDLPVFSDIGRDSGKCRQMPENVGKCCPNDGKCQIRYFFKTPSQNPPPGIIVSYTYLIVLASDWLHQGYFGDGSVFCKLNALIHILRLFPKPIRLHLWQSTRTF